METSENINELASALSKAQGKITGALKDSSNPFFKSKYADLASCWDACRQHLADNGLCVIQTTLGGASDPATVVTRLIHSSGQWVQGRLTLTPKDNGPQAVGSTLTYARRYALAAIVGLAQIDDDANAGTHSDKVNGLPRIDPMGENATKAPSTLAKLIASNFQAAWDLRNNEQILKTHATANQTHDDYLQGWRLLPSDVRKGLKAVIDAANKAVIDAANKGATQ